MAKIHLTEWLRTTRGSDRHVAAGTAKRDYMMRNGPAALTSTGPLCLQANDERHYERSRAAAMRVPTPIARIGMIHGHSDISAFTGSV